MLQDPWHLWSHHFRCNLISKKAAHNSINEYGLKPILQDILPTAGFFHRRLQSVATKQEHHIPANPLLCPYDIEWKPNHGLNTDLPSSPFIVCGADLTIDHSPEPLPPSATDNTNAAQRLKKEEKRQFKAMGNDDAVTPSTVPKHLQPTYAATMPVIFPANTNWAKQCLLPWIKSTLLQPSGLESSN